MAADSYSLSLEGLGIEQPYSMQAEQSVLGAILLDPACVDTAVQTLRPEMFYERHNRAIYTEILTQVTNSEPIDVVILADRLAADPIFTSAKDSKVYLAELADTVPSLSNLPYYVNLVYEKYIKRLLMEHARELLEQAGDDVGSETMLESAEQKLYEIRSGRDTSSIQPLKLAILDIMQHLTLLSGENRDDYLGIPTGFTYLDKVLSGLSRSDLLILAARPGMGKTSFALNIAMNVAHKDHAVAIFSLEMTKDQLAARILSSEARLDSHLFRSGGLKDEDWRDLTQTSELIGPLPVHLDDTPAITIPEMKSKIRRLNNSLVAAGKKPVGLIIIDYLQLMSGTKRTENRVQEISEITRNLKIMAKDLKVPVIALSQLSRSAEKNRTDHRPMLSDLRDSGSIEQDADIVMFLYREAYYEKDNPEVDMMSAECIVAKNRHGETATVNMVWDGAHTRFYEKDFAHE